MTAPRLVVGIVTPHGAPGPEVEIPAITQGRVSTVLARVGTPADPAASATPAALDSAARSFAGQRLDAVGHASTTTGYLIGAAAEETLVRRLTDRCGVPAAASCAAAVGVLRAHGVDHLQLVHPPWFAHELDDLGAAYFRSQGFDAVVTRADDLADDPSLVDPPDVVAWVEQHLEDGSDALFLAGNGFRTAAAVDELERRTGRVVLSANQALLDGMLSALA